MTEFYRDTAVVGLQPNQNNIRLFYDFDDLGELRDIFRRYVAGEDVALPAAPELRWFGETRAPELISGHRRVLAAKLEGVQILNCRYIEMSDEEAYKYIAKANHYAAITPVEQAVRSYEMHLMGYTPEEIAEAMGGKIGISRYIAVGRLIDRAWFSDGPKPDVSIIVWFEAVRFGAEHMARCFHHWTRGLWTAEECQREFRRRGKALPLDNQEKGFRSVISPDGRRYTLRGTIDLDMYTRMELEQVFELTIRDLEQAMRNALADFDALGFGDGSEKRVIRLYNPDTVAA
jgi:hypothetical protein